MYECDNDWNLYKKTYFKDFNDNWLAKQYTEYLNENNKREEQIIKVVKDSSVINISKETYRYTNFDSLYIKNPKLFNLFPK